MEVEGGDGDKEVVMGCGEMSKGGKDTINNNKQWIIQIQWIMTSPEPVCV